MSLYPNLTEEIPVRTGDEESEDVTIGKKTLRIKMIKLNESKIESQTVF